MNHKIHQDEMKVQTIEQTSLVTDKKQLYIKISNNKKNSCVISVGNKTYNKVIELIKEQNNERQPE